MTGETPTPLYGSPEDFVADPENRRDLGVDTEVSAEKPTELTEREKLDLIHDRLTTARMHTIAGRAQAGAVAAAGLLNAELGLIEGMPAWPRVVLGAFSIVAVGAATYNTMKAAGPSGEALELSTPPQDNPEKPA